MENSATVPRGRQELRPPAKHKPQQHRTDDEAAHESRDDHRRGSATLDGDEGSRDSDERDEPQFEPFVRDVALVVGEAHLAELVVHPAHRREGRARALLSAVIAEQEPGTRVTLTVAVDNDPARSLYESVGFEAIGRQPEFFKIESTERDAAESQTDASDVAEGKTDANNAAEGKADASDSTDRTVDAVVYAYDVPE